MPGYDDRKARPGSGFARSRDGGEYYRQNWRAAIDSKPHWVIVNSFNEWPEGTYIEPSQAYGHLYLDLTREWAARFKGASFTAQADPPPPPKPTATATVAPPTQAPQQQAVTPIPPPPTLMPLPPAPTPFPPIFGQDLRDPARDGFAQGCGYILAGAGSGRTWILACPSGPVPGQIPVVVY
jgi:hypothetical protein